MAAVTSELSRREQKSADSRARILEAAVSCLVEDGYSGVTTTRIQERADISRGRLLHHFPSREVLLIAAAEHLARERIRSMLDRADAQIPGDLTGRERIRRVVDLMWQTFHEPHFAAAMEVWVAARTNPDIAQALLPGERMLGEVINVTLDRLWGGELTSRPRYPMVRELLLTSMRGAAMTYSFRPREPMTDPHVEQWLEVADVLLSEPAEGAEPG